jgi:glycosyltransferase involved in cell wall biosynthesis
MDKKPKILITLSEKGVGGPTISHKRIMESELADKYEFIPLYTKRIRQMLTPRFFRELKKIIREEKPDIIHCTGLQTDGFLIVLICKLINRKCPIILAVHGSTKEAQDVGLMFKSIVNYLEKWTLSHCAACYGVSDYVSSWDLLRNNTKFNYGTIYNLAPKIPKIESSKSQLRIKYGFDDSDIVIVSTGRITEDKGYGVLLDIIKKGQWQNNIKFLIVGDGDYLPVIKKEIAYSNVDNTICTGHLNDINEVLTLSDIFIMCSFHETFCISIIEAGIFGLPVVATNVGGINEITENGLFGLLFDPGNSEQAISLLKKLILCEELRESLGKGLKRKVEETYSVKSIIYRLDDIYQLVLANDVSR